MFCLLFDLISISINSPPQFSKMCYQKSPVYYKIVLQIKLFALLLNVFIQPIKHILSSLFNIRFILRIDIFSSAMYKTMSLSRINFNFIIDLTIFL